MNNVILLGRDEINMTCRTRAGCVTHREGFTEKREGRIHEQLINTLQKISHTGHVACQALRNLNPLKLLLYYLVISVKTCHLVTAMIYSVTIGKLMGQVCSYESEDSLGLSAG